MAHSQIPNTFQSRPSYRQVLHKPFIQPQDDHLMQQFQTNFNTLLNQPKSPVQPLQLQIDEQTHQNIQTCQIKQPELIPQVIKYNMHIDPEFIIIKKQNKRKPKQIQPSTQKFVKAPNQISAGFKYQRQKIQPTMDESFHTGYAAETQQQPIIIPQPQLSLFDQLLKQAPPPQQVQFIKQLDTMGPFEYCLGFVDGQEIHYVRQECIQDAPIYTQFGIQLQYPK